MMQSLLRFVSCKKETSQLELGGFLVTRTGIPAG